MTQQKSGASATMTDLEKVQIDVRAKAVGFAIDWSKHLATLATGTVVVSGTFLKDLLKKSPEHTWLMMFSWGCLILSLILSGLVVGALITVINAPSKISDIDVFSSPSRGLALIQSVLFIVGLIAFVTFVSLNF